MFTTFLIVAALLSFGAAWFIPAKVAKSDTLWKTVPREKNIGIVFAFLALTYGAYHGRFMLEGSLESLRPYVWVVLPIVTVCVYLYLDFILARAIGGLLLLAGVYFPHEAFSNYVEFRAFLSLNCYILGTIGLFFIGMPWLFRNLLEKVKDHALTAKALTVYMAISGLIFLTFAIL